MVAGHAASSDWPPEDHTDEDLKDAVRQLVRTARRLSIRDADDLAQEAFARAIEHGVSCEALPWLRTVVRHLAIDNARRARDFPTGSSSDVDSLHAEASPGPEEATLESDTARLMREALDRMPARYRDAILEAVRAGSASSVARKYDVSNEAAWSLLCRARRRLRLELKRVGYVPVAFAGRLGDVAASLAPSGVALGVAALVVPFGGAAHGRVAQVPSSVRPPPAIVSVATAWTPGAPSAVGPRVGSPVAPGPGAMATAAQGPATPASYGIAACPPGDAGAWPVGVGVRIEDDEEPSPVGGDQSVTVGLVERLPGDARRVDSACES